MTPNTAIGKFSVALLRLISLPLKFTRDSIPFNNTLYLAAKFVSVIETRGIKCECTLKDGGRFQFNLNDPYWSRIVCDHFVYEPEIVHTIDLLAEREFSFLDCGANFGYWSIISVTRWRNCIETIAVEAAEPTYEHLLENCQLNGNRFKTLNRALSNVGNTMAKLHFYAPKHARASIDASSEDTETHDVETLTLDGLAALLDDQSAPLVIKLDIEGMELLVIESIGDIFNRDFCLIYEDHGKDGSSKITDEIIKKGVFSIYFMSGSGKLCEIKSSGDATAKKLNRRRGYNFIATVPESGTDKILRSALGLDAPAPRG